MLQWMRKKRQESKRPDKDCKAGIHKRSFELNYHGGTIWCEHLDGMGHHEQKVVEKFERDMSVFLRSSVSSSMIINLDETFLTVAITDTIVNGLTAADKKFRKIAFVGVSRKHQPVFSTLTGAKHSRGGKDARNFNVLDGEWY